MSTSVGSPCSICKRPMAAMPVVTPAAKSLNVTFCRVCDRRRCTACDHHKQDTKARVCSSCGERF